MKSTGEIRKYAFFVVMIAFILLVMTMMCCRLLTRAAACASWSAATCLPNNMAAKASLENIMQEWYAKCPKSKYLSHVGFIKGRGMYCSVYGKVHIKHPLLLIEKSSLCGGSGFPSKKCVNVTI